MLRQCIYLGICLKTGEGINKNEEEAAKWLKKHLSAVVKRRMTQYLTKTASMSN
jgi:hypothetical protein